MDELCVLEAELIAACAYWQHCMDHLDDVIGDLG